MYTGLDHEEVIGGKGFLLLDFVPKGSIEVVRELKHAKREVWAV
jgi:hypothetical protein